MDVRRRAFETCAAGSYPPEVIRRALASEPVSSPPRWLAPRRISYPWGYGFAALTVGVTVMLRAVFEVWLSDRAPTYMVFLAPIVLTSVLAGLRPGLFAWLLSWVIAFYVFVNPAFTYKSSTIDLCISAIFGVEGLALAYLGGAARVSLDRLVARDAQLAASEAQLREANEAKDEFLGMMSHELRTPITVIRGGAHVLRSSGDRLDDDTRRGLLTDLERESERLSRMLENLLALARVELDGGIGLEPVLLQRLLPRLLETIGSGSRRLSFSAEGDIPAVPAEPEYIEHILRNLIGNAEKYGPSDATIEVVVEPCTGGALVRVADRGFGVPQDEAARIFERFYRSDRTSRLAGGAGLGLAVCKRLVEAMSGEIWAAPREGGGLEVTFRLPAYVEEDE